jgi:hypothetical protein
MTTKEITKLVMFEGRQIRKTIHNDEWWFSVADVFETLTGSVDSRQYIKRMRQRDPELDSYWGTICTPLELTGPRWQTSQNELLKKDAQDGGAVAGRTCKDIEQQTGKPVVSGYNFKKLATPRRKKITP